MGELDTPRYRIVTSASELVYGKIIDPRSEEALLPVVVFSKSSRVAQELGGILMQAWANREAVEQTLETRLATFYSRSQQGLWVKGESSGNYLRLIEAYTDCDSDCILLDTEPMGPTCHNGTQSCFEIPPDIQPNSE